MNLNALLWFSEVKMAGIKFAGLKCFSFSRCMWKEIM